MQVLKSGSAELAAEFGIETGRWSQYSGLGGMPFGAMWCKVSPGGRSNSDRHPERELAVVVQGAARFQASGREEVAAAGSAVLLDSGEEHVMVNLSAHDTLVVLSLFWLSEHPADQAQVAPTGPAGDD
jgi:quercetin dioxygenase-like cupin family protein